MSERGLPSWLALLAVAVGFAGLGWAIGNASAPDRKDAARERGSAERAAFANERRDAFDVARSQAFRGALGEGVRRGRPRGLRDGFAAGERAAGVERRQVAEALASQRGQQTAAIEAQRVRPGLGEPPAPEGRAPQKEPPPGEAPPPEEDPQPPEGDLEPPPEAPPPVEGEEPPPAEEVPPGEEF